MVFSMLIRMMVQLNLMPVCALKTIGLVIIFLVADASKSFFDALVEQSDFVSKL
jgi:hypothetical protein